MRSGMDGSDPVEIIRGDYPAGIAIDYKSARLYWSDYQYGQVDSSDLEGRDRRTIIPQQGYGFWGIVVMGADKIFWSALNPYTINTSRKTGLGVTLVHRESVLINHLALGTRENQSAARFNPCDKSRCSHICALTPKSFRCVCPNGMRLDSDQRTCTYEQS